MPTRLCLEPRCPNPSTYKGRCREHARSNEQAINRAGRNIYSTAKWKHTREAVLHDQPLCPGLPGEPCGEIAVDVHHIVDLDQGGNPWARANLLGLCKHHHGRITRQEQTHG
jgi:5-methylcytosine-specific restriction enzyme A